MNDEIIKVLKEARSVVSKIIGDSVVAFKRIPKLLVEIEKLLNKLEKDNE